MIGTRRSSGFTLIEILVVIVVIGVLVALLVPAVQSARVAARRTRCMNNLKQLGQAIHQHADAHGTFPSGMGSPVLDASYLVQVLPYLEQQPLYNAINLSDQDSLSVLTNNNTTALLMVPSMFLCPSDSRGPRMQSDRTNYAGNAGSDSIRGEGVFIGRPLSPAEIPDGLSQTAGVSEWIAGEGTSERGDRLGSIFQVPPAGNLAEFRGFCESLADNATVDRPEKGMFWISGGLGFSQYNHVLPPGRPSCTSVPGSEFRAYTAGSRHGKGANVLSMDGGVHFVKNSIDARAWSAHGTREGGEVVESLESL